MTCPSFAGIAQPSDGIHKANENAEGVAKSSVKIRALDEYLATEFNVSCPRTKGENSDRL